MLLKLVKRFTAIAVKPARMYFGAFSGALCSFLIFIPCKGVMADVLIRFIATVVIIMATYWKQNPKTLLKLSLVFFMMGFAFAGIIVGLAYLLPDGLFAYANSIIYINVSPLVLVGAVTSAYFFVCVFDKLYKNGYSTENQWQAIVIRDNKISAFDCFLDTGNNLTEPFSGLPVIITHYEQISSLLTDEEQAFLKAQDSNAVPPQGFRPIFYSGVGNSTGVLFAFKPDKLTLSCKARSLVREGYIAVSIKKISCNNCNAIFGTKFFSIGV